MAILALLFIGFCMFGAVGFVFWLAYEGGAIQYRHWLKAETRKADLAKPVKARASEYFTCTACGTGPWHVDWAAGLNCMICPNCSGAD